ncbi:MAG: hypothetical protein ACOX0A_06270 [Thermoguttaceae bacterium]|jgi:hypothetical protein
MNKYCAFAVCALIALASFGCKDKSRPADLPDDMTPSRITITQEGEPLAGATVELEYTTPVKYTTSGATDETGVAVMKTYGYAGAQLGTAKVRVSKLVTEGDSEAEEYGESGSMGTDFNVVDAKYMSFETTDLEITIEKGNADATFDVGAAVRDPVK